MYNADEMAHKYAQEHGKEEVKLPSEFKRHDALFSDEEAKKFPPSRSWDHKIELTSEAPATFNCKMYAMSAKEQITEDKFPHNSATHVLCICKSPCAIWPMSLQKP